jgi:membrane-associated phospholipid phosphatase
MERLRPRSGGAAGPGLRGATRPGTPGPGSPVPPALAVVTLATLLAIYAGALWSQRALYVPKEIVVAAFLLAATAFRRLRPFLRDWAPLLLLLFLMDALREAAYHATVALERPVIVEAPIAFDRALFGALPTLTLQQWLHPSAVLHWYDLPLAALHGSHFLTFLVVGLVVWVWRPEAFRAYATAVLLTSYAGLVGYFLVPTAPPWLAALQGALPPIPRILHTVESLHVPRSLVLGLDTNPVAAMPSLHAAFSLTSVFGLALVSRRAAWIAAPYPVALAVALVYGGEHYVADLVAGYALGLAGFWAGLRLASPAGASGAAAGRVAAIRCGARSAGGPVDAGPAPGPPAGIATRRER